MGLTRIGEEEWDLVDREGRETRLPSEAKAAVEFPTRWRVFGPVGADRTTIDWACKENYKWYKEAIPQVGAAVDELSAVPETLKVGEETFEGRDAVLDGDTLDLDAFFGGHEAGQQAYAAAEIEIESETGVIFGAGCDWWMQWWIDGEVVCDTLPTGNREGFPWPATSRNSVIERTNHCFSRRLSAGRHFKVVRVISGETAWVLRAGLASPRDEFFCSLPQSNRWEFLPDLDEIRPPALDYWTHTMALRTDMCLADETLECELMQPEHSGNVGIVFGAQDSGHYYWAQIPNWGQLWRARAFWAALSMADGSGHFRTLKMQLMPNVPLHRNVWLSLKVERRGNRIQMWVNGVKGPCAVDDTYGAGRVGIAGFSRYHIRNLKIDGKRVEAGAWAQEDRRGRPWAEPEPGVEHGDHHWAWPLLKVSDGEVLLPITILRDGYSVDRTTAENSSVYLYHSLDAGQSWSEYAGPFQADEFPRHGHLFVPQEGVVRGVLIDPQQRTVSVHDSHDRCVTWTPAGSGKLLGDWDRDIFQEGTQNEFFLGFTKLRDSTLVMMLMHAHPKLRHPAPNMGMGTWGTGLLQPYCTRSTDQGLTWSEPVPMDHAADYIGDAPESPAGDFTETPLAELPDGRIVALSRPHRAPFMWQTYSDDGGKSWSAACYAPFSGAGGPSMLVTSSGYLVIVKRGPGLGLNISLDGGLNWDEGTMIDFSTSYNGSMVEVEPDVVLVSYPNSFDEIRPALVRTQRIRITPDGPVPLGTD